VKKAEPEGRLSQRTQSDKYGVEPPAYPKLDLPFSLLFDTINLVPVIMPLILYQTAFD